MDKEPEYTFREQTNYGDKKLDYPKSRTEIIRSRPCSPAPEQLKFHQPGSKVEYTVEQVAEIDKRIREERQSEREKVLSEQNKVCSYCGWHGLNKSHLCGPNHPMIFSGYNCTWCGTKFDRNMVILEIGHDHENSVEHGRSERVKKHWDYESLRAGKEE